MIDISKLNIGDKVHYKPSHFSHYRDYKAENGKVKRITNDLVFVVYHCDNNWDSYEDYTSAATNPRYLEYGWIGGKR